MKTTENKEKISEDKNVFVYNPYSTNNILSISATSKNVFCLLSNGTLLSWGENSATLGRKLANFQESSFLPKMIINQPSMKFVDISCGENHCLARTNFSKVFSWGVNAYGQLGLSGFPMNITSEKTTPQEIQSFKNIAIGQIFAFGNSSFAINSAETEIYAWGSVSV